MKQAVKEFVKIIQKYEMDYDQIIKTAKQAREELGIKKPKRCKSPSQLPTFTELKRFFSIIERKSVIDKILMKLMLYTGIRTFELTGIKIKNIDFSESGKERIWIKRKGGGKNYILIPNVLTDILKLYIQETAKKNIYLFESRYHKPYTERGIRKKFERFREEAEISRNVRAHNFRHFILSYLGADGFTQQQLKNISGHKSAKSLDIYVEKNPETVRKAFNKEISELENKLFGE